MAFEIQQNTTTISNFFIDEYLPKANPSYVMAYLYAFRHAVSGKGSISDEEIATHLDMLQTDVVKAWKYWQEQGLMGKKEDGTLEFLPVEPPIEKQEPGGQEQKALYQYTPKELSCYLERPLVKTLFLSAQEHLGKLLSHREMSIVLGFYDQLGLPADVIELLFGYAVQEGNRNINYIEKIAIDWSEKGIRKKEDALEYIKMRKSGYREILRAFGIAGRLPVATEEEYIKKWLMEFELPMEIVCVACEKTVLQTGRVSFPYADKIIEGYRTANVKSLQDIEAMEGKFQKEKTEAKAKKTVEKLQKMPQKPVKQNRFVNFKQRDWDFAEIERLEKERLRQNGEGSKHG